VEVDRDHESGGVVLESVRPSAKDLLGKDGHVVAAANGVLHAVAAGRRHGAQAPQA